MKQLYLFFISCFLFFNVSAQSSGVGYVTEIESKARSILEKEKQIERLRESIQEYNLAKVAAKEAAQQKLEDALRRIENDQSWKNRLKTAREGWEEYNEGTCSAGGPPPICVADHWFRSSVSKAMQRYNEYKENFLRPYRKAVEDAEKPFEKKIDDAFASIEKLKDEIDDLRAQIPPLTQKYRDGAINKSHDVLKPKIRTIIEMVASKHYLEDKVDELNELREKVSAEMDQAIKDAERTVVEQLNQKIAAVEDRKLADQKRFDIYAAAINKNIQHNQQVVRDYSALLNQEQLRITSIYSSNYEREDASGKAQQYRQKIQEGNDIIRKDEQKLRDFREELQKRQTEFFHKLSELKYSQHSLVKEAQERVRNNYQIRLKSIDESKQKAIENLYQKGRDINSYKDKGRKEFMEWAKAVDAERIRIMNACNSVGVGNYSIYVHGSVVGNWNSAEECIFQAENQKHGAGISYSNCTEFINHYLKYYSFLGGKMENGQPVNRWNKRKTRLDLMYNRVF